MSKLIYMIFLGLLSLPVNASGEVKDAEDSISRIRKSPASHDIPADRKKEKKQRAKRQRCAQYVHAGERVERKKQGRAPHVNGEKPDRSKDNKGKVKEINERTKRKKK